MSLVLALENSQLNRQYRVELSGRVIYRVLIADRDKAFILVCIWGQEEITKSPK